MFKFGIIGAVAFLVVYGRKLAKAIKLRKKLDEPLSSTLLGITAVLTTMLFVNLTSPQFHDRVAVLVIAVFWGIIEGLNSSYGSNRNFTGDIQKYGD